MSNMSDRQTLTITNDKLISTFELFTDLQVLYVVGQMVSCSTIKYYLSSAAPSKLAINTALGVYASIPE